MGMHRPYRTATSLAVLWACLWLAIATNVLPLLGPLLAL